MIPLTLLFFAQKRNLLIPLELSRVMHQGTSVSVFLTDSEGVLAMEDGSEMEFNNKAGDSMLMDAQSHQPRAKTDFELMSTPAENCTFMAGENCTPDDWVTNPKTPAPPGISCER